MSGKSSWWSKVEPFRTREKGGERTAYVVTTSLPTDNQSGEIVLKKFLSLVGANYQNVHLIISGAPKPFAAPPEWLTIKSTNTRERDVSNIFGKMYYTLKAQLLMCLALIGARTHKADVFFFNAGILFFPHVVARMKGARTVYFRFGDITLAPVTKYPGWKGRLIGSILGFLQYGNIRTAKLVAVESMALAEQEPLLQKIIKKVVEISLFVDLEKFQKNIDMDNRDCDFLFMGRLAKEKGVGQLLESVSLESVWQGSPPQLTIVGSGPLTDLVVEASQRNSSVSYIGWVDHDSVPQYLNRAKIVVLPSETEGLPNIIIEGMASGAVPMATPVGGIPGVVHHGFSGFLLNDVTPESFGRDLKKALYDADLEAISNNAEKYCREMYSYEAAVKRMEDSLGIG